MRDAGGTPYAGGPVSWSFTTSTAVVLGGEVHPELFHIERPVDGVAVVTGAPGALPVAPAGFTPWSVSPILEEDVADPVGNTFSADTVGGVSATVGNPPGHPVTEASRVWLRVFDSDGTLAEQFRLGPFATADGRGFIAPPGEDSTFTTADGVAVDVPAGAFDQPTLVTVTPLDPAGIGADLPEGMALGAYVRLDFAGEAHDTLRVHVPAPAGLAPGTQAFMVTPVDLPWGRRLRLIDVGGVLEKDGASYLSNDPTLQPEPTASGGGGGLAHIASLDLATTCADVRASGNGECFMASAFEELRIRSDAAFLFEATSQMAIVAGPAYYMLGRSFEAYMNLAADQLVFLPPATDWNSHWVLPVPVGQPFTIARRDAAAGWNLGQQDYDPIGSGGGLNLVGPIPDPSAGPPRLVSASPFQLLTFAAPPAGTTERLRLEVDAEADDSGHIALHAVDGLPLPAASGVALYDLAAEGHPRALLGPTPLCGSTPFWDRWVSASRDMLLVVSPGDLDPSDLETLELELDRPLRADVADATTSTLATLTDLGPVESCPVATESRDIPLSHTLASGNRRLVLQPLTTLPDGHRFRLTLTAEHLVDAQGTAYPPGAPSEFLFATRPREAEPLTDAMAGSPPAARDLLQVGNLLLAATADGRLVAVDASTPTGVPDGRLTVHAVGDFSGEQVRALATDGHGRIAFAMQLGASWSVKVARVEDVRGADQPCPDMPAWVPEGTPCFPVQDGGVKIGYSVDASSGLLATEWLALGAMPTGTPVDLEMLVDDETGETRDLASFYGAYRADGTPETLGEVSPNADGSMSITLELRSSYRRASDGAAEPTTGTVLTLDDVTRPETCDDEPGYDRYQRVTVDNVTTGQTWSTDIENPWDGSGATGIATLEVTARPTDLLRVRYNLRAYGYLAVMGSGITVIDLDRFYRLPLSSASPGAMQCGRRLAALEGQEVDFSPCSPPGSGPHGLAFTPSLAVLGATGCGGSGSCRGEHALTVVSPLVHLGGIVSQSPTEQPGELGVSPPLACISTVAGTPTQLHAVAVAEDVPWIDRHRRGSLDGTFSVPPDLADAPAVTRTGDLVAMSLGDAGAFVFDASRRDLELIGHLHAEGHSVFRLQVDAARGLLLAGGFDAAGAPVIDLWKLATVNGGADESRPLATLQGVPWTTADLGLDTTGTGLLHTWDSGRGADAVPYAEPTLELLRPLPGRRAGGRLAPPRDPLHRPLRAPRRPAHALPPGPARRRRRAALPLHGGLPRPCGAARLSRRRAHRAPREPARTARRQPPRHGGPRPGVRAARRARLARFCRHRDSAPPRQQ